MADPIISVVAKKIKALILGQARCIVYLVYGAEKILSMLAKELVEVRRALDDEERRGGYRDESIMLSRLEQTCYEVEDVLEEAIYAIYKPEMEKVRSFIPTSLRYRLTKASRKKIFDVSAKLDEVWMESRLILRLGQPSPDPLHKTTDFSGLEVVRGRGFDRDILAAKLMDRREELGIQVVCVVGVGGLGKTTLAQLVYNDSRVEKCFHLRIWVCVSDCFDLASIAKEVLETIQKGSSLDINRLDSLLNNVEEFICEKRFLLVLDDVRHHDSGDWNILKSYLKCGRAGSKVLVTTRNQINAADITDTMDHDDVRRLRKLTDEECWLLLHDEVSFGRNEEVIEGFKDVGVEITKKCRGLPLVARGLGRLLRSKSRLEDWSNVLNAEMWQLEAAELYIFPHFLSSYNKFSPMQKRCFSYCAVFPKDSEIVVEELIGNWMAFGYLGSNTGDMEQKGRECFEFFASDSLFQDFKKDGLDGEIKSCKMPDIVHDFARYIRKSGRLNEGRLNNTTCGACDPSLISTANEFRSLFSGCFDDIRRCDCLKRLRVLGVPKRDYLQSFPQGMENLIHLRWLKLDGNKLYGENLKTIFQLYYLQTLLMKNCKLEVIPGEIGNLILLRCLDLSFNDDLKELPESMGRLEELRSLKVENCAGLIRLPKEMDKLINLKDLRNDLTFGVNGLCSLGLLKNMNLLSGTLRLKIRFNDDDLEDVVETAREAKLSEKRGIERLVMEFEDETKKEEGSSVRRLNLIEALETQRELKSLEIWSYNGTSLPAWIVSPGLKHLRKLRIMNCDRITSLLPLVNLQRLEEIEMFSLYGLQSVERGFLATTAAGAVAFPELKKLTFRRCPNWKEWEDIMPEEEGSAAMSFAPRLTHLTLKLCTGLSELPHRLLRNMPSLKVLDISYSEKLEQRYGLMDSSVRKSLFGEARFRIDWRR